MPDVLYSNVVGAGARFELTHTITNLAVFLLRILSPLGCSAHFCCARCKTTLDNTNEINRSTINQCASELLSTDDYFHTELICELLQVKSGGLMLSGPEFTYSDITDMINSLAHL